MDIFNLINSMYFNNHVKGDDLLEVKSPNGYMYRYSSNLLSKEDLNNYKEKLEGATSQKEFDKIWNTLTGNFDLGSLFNKNALEDRKKFRHKEIGLDDLNNQIKYHENKVNELHKLKESMEQGNKRKEIQEEITSLEKQIDNKLKLFSQNLNDKKMKDKLSKEMTDLYNKKIELEKELNNL